MAPVSHITIRTKPRAGLQRREPTLMARAAASAAAYTLMAMDAPTELVVLGMLVAGACGCQSVDRHG